MSQCLSLVDFVAFSLALNKKRIAAQSCLWCLARLSKWISIGTSTSNPPKRASGCRKLICSLSEFDFGGRIEGRC